MSADSLSGETFSIVSKWINLQVNVILEFKYSYLLINHEWLKYLNILNNLCDMVISNENKIRKIITVA